MGLSRGGLLVFRVVTLCLYSLVGARVAVSQMRLTRFKKHMFVKTRGDVRLVALMLATLFIYPLPWFLLSWAGSDETWGCIFVAYTSQLCTSIYSTVLFHRTMKISFKIATVQQVKYALKQLRRASADAKNNNSSIPHTSAPSEEEKRSSRRAQKRSVAAARGQRFIRLMQGRVPLFSFFVFLLSFVVVFYVDPTTWTVLQGRRSFSQCNAVSSTYVILIYLGWALPYSCLYDRYRRFDTFGILFNTRMYTIAVSSLVTVWLPLLVLNRRGAIASNELYVANLYMVGAMLLVTAGLECELPVRMVIQDAIESAAGDGEIRPDLSEVLAFPPTLEKFEDHVIGEWSPENLHFYQDTSRFEGRFTSKPPRDPKRALARARKAALEIYLRYLHPNAKTPLNLSVEVLRPLHRFFRGAEFLNIIETRQLRASLVNVLIVGGIGDRSEGSPSASSVSSRGVDARGADSKELVSLGHAATITQHPLQTSGYSTHGDGIAVVPHTLVSSNGLQSSTKTSIKTSRKTSGKTSRKTSRKKKVEAIEMVSGLGAMRTTDSKSDSKFAAGVTVASSSTSFSATSSSRATRLDRHIRNKSNTNFTQDLAGMRTASPAQRKASQGTTPYLYCVVCIFRRARKEVYELMVKDSYQRFLKKTDVQALLKQSQFAFDAAIKKFREERRTLPGVALRSKSASVIESREARRAIGSRSVSPGPSGRARSRSSSPPASNSQRDRTRSSSPAPSRSDRARSSSPAASKRSSRLNTKGSDDDRKGVLAVGAVGTAVGTAVGAADSAAVGAAGSASLRSERARSSTPVASKRGSAAAVTTPRASDLLGTVVPNQNTPAPPSKNGILR